MDWITGILLLLALVVVGRLLYINLKPSRPKKHTIKLQEPTPKGDTSPNLLSLFFLFTLFLLLAFFAAQFLLGRL